MQDCYRIFTTIVHLKNKVAKAYVDFRLLQNLRFKIVVKIYNTFALKNRQSFHPSTHFSLFFSGKCNSYQRNSFSINIDHIKLDATGYWIYVNTSHMDYYRFYKYNFAFSNDTLLKSFDHGSFTLKARIDASCAAILRIQFFHNLDSYRNPLAR